VWVTEDFKGKYFCSENKFNLTVFQTFDTAIYNSLGAASACH